MDKHVLITIKVVATVLVFGLSIYVLVKLAPIFATLLIALFLSLAIEPAVEYFQKLALFNKPIPRGLAVGFSYFLFLLVVVFIVTVGFPPIWAQAQKLLMNLDSLILGISLPEGYELSLESITSSIPNFSDKAINKTFSIFSNIGAILSTIVISLYISMDWENIKSRFINLFSGKLKDAVSTTLHEIEDSIGSWVKGQLILMLVVGLLSFLGLVVLGIDYPLALGLMAGLLEIVPIIGPLISWVLAALVGFSVSYVKGIMATGVFILVQQLENNFLVPKVMQRVSGLSPLIILIALLIAGKFFGIIGVILAVPLTMSTIVIVKNAIAFSK